MDESLYIFKIIIAGDSGVGKTSLVRRYVDNKFIPAKKATIGIDYFLKNIKIKYPGLETTIALQIWDLAGEEKYRSFLPIYLPGTQGLFLVYSEDIKKSFKYLSEFLETLNQLLKQKIPIILIKAKNDLEQTSIEHEEVQNFMTKFEIKDFFDTSAKTGENVNQAFQKITELMVKANNLI